MSFLFGDTPKVLSPFRKNEMDLLSMTNAVATVFCTHVRLRKLQPVHSVFALLSMEGLSVQRSPFNGTLNALLVKFLYMYPI